MATETYSLSVDFGGALKPDLFQAEVEADGGIAPTCNDVRIDEDDVNCEFSATLSAGEKTTLDGLVSSHTVPAFQGEIVPPQITANVNDYCPIGLGDETNVLLLSSDANSRAITGIDASCFSVNSPQIILVNNNSSDYDIELKAEDVGSSTANRFSTYANHILKQKDALRVVYVRNTSRWYILDTI